MLNADPSYQGSSLARGGGEGKDLEFSYGLIRQLF